MNVPSQKLAFPQDFPTARSGVMSKVRCSQSNNHAKSQKKFWLFSKSEHHQFSTVPRPALSPPQAPHGTGRGLERFSPKRAGGRSTRGCRERLSPKPKPTFSPEGFGDRLAAHDASNPPSLRLCPAGWEPRHRPLP